MQTRDTAQLTVTSDSNSETYIGSANADCEGLFTGPTGGSLTWNISHNTFAHGIGGSSCNGGEFWAGSGNPTINVSISHSTFEDDPGDMLEEVDAGTRSTINLTIDDVTVNHTTLTPRLPPEAKFISAGANLGRCLDVGAWGHENMNTVHMTNSLFSDCAGDGIGATVTRAIDKLGSVTIDLGDGAGDSVLIDVEKSTISNVQQDVFHFTNLDAMNQLSIKVEGSQLSNAKGPALIAFDQNASTEDANIDLGGGTLGSTGENCIIGAANDYAEVTGYDVFAEQDWWGSPGGPPAANVSTTHGSLNFLPALASPAASCSGTE
jgi:hypothetical protein